MPSIVNDRVAWSVGLFVIMLPSEPRKNVFIFYNTES